MRGWLAIVTIAGLATPATAQLKSPDGRYEITYTSAGLHEPNVEFRDSRSGKVIHDGSSTSYQLVKYREVLWSVDSKYVALISRGTRTTTDLEILHFDDGVVTELKLPNYRAEIQKQKPSAKGGRYHWVSKLRWKGSQLTFRCAGQWEDGSGDPQVAPDNWYRLDVTLDVETKGKAPKLRVVAAEQVEGAVEIK